MLEVLTDFIVYDLTPFYRGAKVTVIGAISIEKVLAVMTMNGSMDGNAFEVFIEKCLLPKLWPGAVVVMDNVAFHKVATIEPLIQSVGACVLYMSPYSPDFNPPIALVVTTESFFTSILS